MSPEVQKIANMSEALFDEGYDYDGERCNFLILWRVSNRKGIDYKRIHLLLRNKLMQALPLGHIHVIPMHMMMVQVLMVLPLMRVALSRYHHKESTI